METFSMKIALAASSGGHLTELDMILTDKIIGNNEKIILTEKTERTKKIKDKVYFFDMLGYNPFSYFLPMMKSFKILRKEKVKLVVTTGAEIGLVALIAGKLLGLKTVFIEIAGNPKTPSMGSKLSYFFSDIFLVQYPDLVRKYGKRARYVGGII